MSIQFRDNEPPLSSKDNLSFNFGIGQKTFTECVFNETFLTELEKFP